MAAEITNHNVNEVLAELRRSFPSELEVCVLRVELARAQTPPTDDDEGDHPVVAAV